MDQFQATVSRFKDSYGYHANQPEKLMLQLNIKPKTWLLHCSPRDNSKITVKGIKKYAFEFWFRLGNKIRSDAFKDLSLGVFLVTVTYWHFWMYHLGEKYQAPSVYNRITFYNRTCKPERFYRAVEIKVSLRSPHGEVNVRFSKDSWFFIWRTFMPGCS